MTRWIRGVKVTDRFRCNELRDYKVMQQNRLRWCRHVSRKYKHHSVRKNAWITKWRVQDLEADHRKPEMRLWEKTGPNN